MEWELKKISISELKEYEKNPRKFTSKGLADLKKSIEKFGVAEPLVVNNDYEIIGGHGRLATLKDLGIAFVDCYFPKKTLTKKQVEELNIRLNKNIAGEWDFDLLSGFDEEMLVDIGWDGSELDKIFVKDNSDLDEFDAPDESEAITKLGDIYLLGKHRLMCGDSTKKEDVERLMAGEKADFLFTSPPYNLGVSAKLSGNTSIGKKGNCYEDYNDDQQESDWFNLIDRFFLCWIDFAEYICVNVQSLAGNRKSLWRFIYEHSEQFCDVAIWNKDFGAPAMAHKVMNSCFEFLLFFCKENPSRAIRTADFRGNVNNVFDIPPQRKNEFSEIHGATFPIELPEKIIGTFTGRGMVIADAFGGTGTTLIACEQLNRKCYMMELAPKYCDVIISRWENLTNKKAEKIK